MEGTKRSVEGERTPGNAPKGACNGCGKAAIAGAARAGRPGLPPKLSIPSHPPEERGKEEERASMAAWVKHHSALPVRVGLTEPPPDRGRLLEVAFPLVEGLDGEWLRDGVRSREVAFPQSPADWPPSLDAFIVSGICAGFPAFGLGTFLRFAADLPVPPLGSRSATGFGLLCTWHMNSSAAHSSGLVKCFVIMSASCAVVLQ